MNPDDWQGLIPEMGLRPVQFDALARIWAAYEDGAEVVLLEAPTGVGKSIIQLKKELARKQKASRGSRREPGTRDMIPAQIVRALGTAARLTGQAGRQAHLAAPGLTTRRPLPPRCRWARVATTTR